MSKRILLLQGHPDDSTPHFGHALAEAYADGARAAGHEVRTLALTGLDFPLLRRRADWESGPVPEGLKDAQTQIAWCEHLVLLIPLWLGDMPALVKAFLEQVARPGFAFSYGDGHGFPRKLLAGRSARVVVTMGMPAAVYRWLYRAHSVKALERNILGFVGFAPVHESLIGMVEAKDDAGRKRWLARRGGLRRSAP